MCMWCAATRNLQRPEMDWEASYPLAGDRDRLLFAGDPMPFILEPPLTFVQSVTALSSGGVEEIIAYSPENERRIESLIETYKAGASHFSRLTVNVHITFDPTMTPSDRRSSSFAHIPRPTKTPSSAAVFQSHHQPLSPRSSHTPPPVPPRPYTFATSASNVHFVYPSTVSPNSYVSRLSNPSDVWKTFNPALCQLKEKPKLIVLRDCRYVPQRGDPDGSLLFEKEREARSEFLGGSYDIAAVDYRGNYDCSYHAWFLRKVGSASSSDMRKRGSPSEDQEYMSPPTRRVKVKHEELY